MKTEAEIEELLLKKAQLWSGVEHLDKQDVRLIIKMIELERRVNMQTLDMIFLGLPPKR